MKMTPLVKKGVIFYPGGQKLLSWTAKIRKISGISRKRTFNVENIRSHLVIGYELDGIGLNLLLICQPLE